MFGEESESVYTSICSRGSTAIKFTAKFSHV